jgi:hypothetical protein
MVALHRFIEVSLGILIALVISLTLWPNHARRSLREGLAGAVLKLGELYQAVMSTDRRTAGSLEALNAQVSDAFLKNAGLLENALQEAFGSLRERESVALLAAQVERIRLAVESVEVALRDGAADIYPRRFDTEWEQVRTGAAAAFGSLANSIRTGKLESPWPDLLAPVCELDAKAAVARKSGATASYPLDEILRFYSQLLGSRTLAQELEVARALVASRFVSK